MKKSIGIYCITCHTTNKKYIGQSKRIEERIRDHIYELKNNKHKNIFLQRAWNFYGEDAFCFSILCNCSEFELDKKEREYITKYKTTEDKLGYNLTSGGNINSTFTETSKIKLSISHKGKTRTLESRIKQSITNTGRIGYKKSEDTKRKISNSLLGRSITDETKEKITVALHNRPKKKGTSSKYFGVCKYKNNKWQAKIKINTKQISLGNNFICEIDAAIAYDNAVIQYRNGTGNLNFPEYKDILMKFGKEKVILTIQESKI